jgi:hypothetical protein
VKILENLGTTIPDIADALRRYQNIAPMNRNSPQIRKGMIVALIRRSFDQLDFISIAKDHVELKDFKPAAENDISGKEPRKAWRKKGGLFIIEKILKNPRNTRTCKDIKTPKTWYITSDAIIEFCITTILKKSLSRNIKISTR